jgi:acetyl/propionyl-CoA carboxylase alpha subunit
MRIYAEDPARDFQPTTGRVLVFDLPCGACPAAPSIRVSYSVGRSADYATSEIWDDGILDPVDTGSELLEKAIEAFFACTRGKHIAHMEHCRSTFCAHIGGTNRCHHECLSSHEQSNQSSGAQAVLAKGQTGSAD